MPCLLVDFAISTNSVEPGAVEFILVSEFDSDLMTMRATDGEEQEGGGESRRSGHQGEEGSREGRQADHDRGRGRGRRRGGGRGFTARPARGGSRCRHRGNRRSDGREGREARREEEGGRPGEGRG